MVDATVHRRLRRQRNQFHKLLDGCLLTFLSKAVLEAVAGDGELLRELVGLFREDSPLMTEELHAALAAGDSNRLGRAAHKMAGAISIFHARRPLLAARRLEELARTGNLDDAPLALADLESALAMLHPALDKLVKKTLKRAAGA